MQFLDQTKQPDGSYTVRIWRDEVAPDAIDTYNWVAYNDKMPQSKSEYETSQVEQAKALSALQVPAVQQAPTVITQNDTAITEQTAAAAAQDDSAPASE